jgi:hypothetical protein
MDATLDDVETILGGRTRGLLQAANVSDDYTADSSPRSYMADPIAYAIRKSGGTPSGIGTVADGDFDSVETGLEDQLLDVAELRLIDNCLGWWTRPNQSQGPRSQQLKDLAEFFLKRAECLRTKIKDVYQIDASEGVMATGGTGGFSDEPGVLTGI